MMMNIRNFAAYFVTTDVAEIAKNPAWIIVDCILVVWIAIAAYLLYLKRANDKYDEERKKNKKLKTLALLPLLAVAEVAIPVLGPVLFVLLFIVLVMLIAWIIWDKELTNAFNLLFKRKGKTTTTAEEQKEEQEAAAPTVEQQNDDVACDTSVADVVADAVDVIDTAIAEPTDIQSETVEEQDTVAIIESEADSNTYVVEADSVVDTDEKLEEVDVAVDAENVKDNDIVATDEEVKEEVKEDIVVADEKADVAVAEDSQEAIETPADVTTEAVETEKKDKTFDYQGHTTEYKWSFIAKLCVSDNEVKGYYSAIKNELLSYSKVRSRVSWQNDTFKADGSVIAKLKVRGKKVLFYMALWEENAIDSKYKVKYTKEKKFDKSPACLAVKSDRTLKYAFELIAILVNSLGLEKRKKYDKVDYVSELAYKELDQLLVEGLVRKVNSESKTQRIAKPKVTKKTVEAQASQAIEDVTEAQAEVVSEEKEEKSKSVEAVAEVKELSHEEEEEKQALLDEIQKKAAYKWSFSARLAQSSDEIKGYYSSVKNTILSKKGVKSRVSWTFDTFKYDGKVILKIKALGKKLMINYALPPEKYSDSKYKVQVSAVSKYQDVPCGITVKSERTYKYAMEMLVDLIDLLDLIDNKKYQEIDYVGEYPDGTNEEFLAKGWLKLKKADATDDEGQNEENE